MSISITRIQGCPDKQVSIFPSKHTVFTLIIQTPQLFTMLVKKFEQVNLLPDVVSKIAGGVWQTVFLELTM